MSDSPEDLRTPVIQAKVFAGILNAAGLPRDRWAPLMADEGLTPSDLAGVSASIPLLSYVRMFDRLSASLDRVSLGIELSDKIGPELVGAIGYVFKYSPSLETGIAAFAENVFSIQGVTRLSFERTPEPMLVYAITDEAIQPRRQDVEFSLGYVNALIRSYLDGRFSPREVYFEHAGVGNRERYERFFGCPVYFEQDYSALVLDESDLRRGSAQYDPALVALLKHYIQLLDDRDRAATTHAESIDQVLSGLIETRAVDFPLVASRLGKSQETLRRRLRQEGVSFRDILRKKRIAMAKRHLVDSTMSILEIAQKVGYSETASFTRAFIAETGLRPSEFRAKGR